MEKDNATQNTTGAESAAPAKKTTRPRRATAAVSSPDTETQASGTPAAEDAAPAKKAPVRRSRAKKTTPVVEAASTEPSLLDAIAENVTENVIENAAAEPAAAAGEKPAKRTTRRRASSPVTAPAASEQGVQGELSLAGHAETDTATAEKTVEPVAKAPARRSRAAKSPVTSTAVESAEPKPADSDSIEMPAAATEKKSTRTRRTATKAATKAPAKLAEAAPAPAEIAEPAAEPAAAEHVEVLAEAPAKAPARRVSRRAVAPVQSPVAETVAEVPQENAVPSAEAVPPAEPVPSEGDAVAEQEPAKTTRRRRSTSKITSPAPEAAVSETASEDEAVVAAASAETAHTAPVTESLFLAPVDGVSALFLAPDLSLAVPAPAAAESSDDDGSGEQHDGDRRGRGRNRNRRNRGSDHDHDQSESADSEESSSADDEEILDDGVTSRRRRRRRRGDQDLELTGGSEEDPPNTVTRVRAPRQPADHAPSNRVTSLRGSTRLEAKKQRRRDSRDSGRRRTVITEAEFLARRESVDRVMVVRQNDERIQIGVLEDGILAEHFVSKTQQDSLIGNVYLGKVQNVLPSMEAAFVDIGRGRNAVLYAGEVDWDAANLNGQPRRIENALKSGDSVLVQVSKDPVGHKGARLTSQISLPGRYLVFVPGGSMTGISRKLPDVERNRLKRVLKDHLPENAGVIVRTAAEGASEEELTNDINRLRAQWEGISERASSHKTLAPEMLYAEPDLTIKVVRDVFNEDFTKLIVSGDEAWDTIEAYVTYVAPDLLDRLEKWSKPEDIFAAHRIDEQINKALERKVFLPSGGSLVIDRTEAMTVVDVNTGKFTGSGGNLEETVTKNNLEAAEEVVRQLRLRDIGGIIVIDFIDMVLESNRDLVLRRLVECLGRDRTKHQVAEVTSLGLVQMTRKRMGTGLLEVFGELCPSCAGRGMVTHEIPVEHRRTHSPAVEAAHAQAPRHEQHERAANRQTRSERKRNRNNRQHDHDEPLETVPVVAPLVVDEAEAAQKAQKASEARAALANIAAAAAASHQGLDGALTVGDADQSAHDDEHHDATTVTLGGEAVELPRGHRSESTGFISENSVDTAAALAGLTQALDQLSAPAESGGASAEAAAPASHEGGNRSRSRRGRRNRSARSAQGGADTAVETSDAGTPARREAPREKVQAPAAAAKPAAEPIILGVGVPASEIQRP